jgi:hypothetical protein
MTPPLDIAALRKSINDRRGAGWHDVTMSGTTAIALLDALDAQAAANNHLRVALQRAEQHEINAAAETDEARAILRSALLGGLSGSNYYSTAEACATAEAARAFLAKTDFKARGQ